MLFSLLVKHQLLNNHIKFGESLKEKLKILNTTSELNTLQDGDPVYISGEIRFLNSILDPELKVKFNNTIYVEREVEMYQLEESIRNEREKKWTPRQFRAKLQHYKQKHSRYST